MYHMNTSMNVGCTHCHNSRYFPTYEVPAKYYAMNMLQMSQHIWNTYTDSLANKQPSCNMCHQGAVIPPGAARSAAVMPDQIDSIP
jgi:photosynthetic reaction center cytochrome c subunit